jgi:hypothetical protein
VAWQLTLSRHRPLAVQGSAGVLRSSTPLRASPTTANSGSRSSSVARVMASGAGRLVASALVPPDVPLAELVMPQFAPHLIAGITIYRRASREDQAQ